VGRSEPGSTSPEDSARRHLALVPKASERYLSVREIASRYGVSTATIYDAVKRGEIPHVRVRNAICVPESALP
jgi:excisionase family DNA binding protein